MMDKLSRGAKPVCLLLTLGVCALLPASRVFAADDCCSIVAIDATTGTITLRNDNTGKVEKVTVKDPKRLAKLIVGHRTDHIGARYCSISTFEPCLDQVRTHNCQPCPDEH
jgi:hypothetical protein